MLQQMDCDKDKAARAKEVAENMFDANDIVKALKFALKARRLFPSLEGIVEMIVTFNVHISAMNKINGETDWYSVLKVDPMADYDALKKQYSKLSLMLHPDKNKSVGADGAFNLVSQAWSILSDRAKKVEYDEKINNVMCSLSTECLDPPEQTEAMNPEENNQKISTDAEDASKIVQKAWSKKLFWTGCHRCKSYNQYFSAYVNHRLVCNVCHKPFFAVVKDRPERDIYRLVTPKRILKIQQDSHQSLADSDFNWDSSRTFDDASSTDQAMYEAQKFIANRKIRWSQLIRTSSASSAAREKNVVMVQKIDEKLKRRRDEDEQKSEEASLGFLHISKKGYYSPAKVSEALENLSLSSNQNLLVLNTGKSNHNVSRVDGNFFAIGAYRAELYTRGVETDIEEISRKLGELKADTDDSEKPNEAGEEEYLRNEDTCYQNNVGKLEDRMSGSQATNAGTDMADMVAENMGKMSINVSDNVVIEAGIDDKKESNVEELIDDIGIIGDEKKGDDR